jgi:hypothetical protein
LRARSRCGYNFFKLKREGESEEEEEEEEGSLVLLPT